MAMGKYTVVDVFTPTRPARISFVERESINEKLVNALQTPGKQIVIYGHSGSGKTTLLENKLCQLYENHLTTRCMSGMTFEQILRDAFDQLGKYYEAGLKTNNSSSLSAEIAGEYLGIKAKLNTKVGVAAEVENKRILPPELTPQRLGQYIGAANCCWVLEDFHKVSQDHRNQLSQIMKVFMDLADRWPSLKIIAIGAVDTARLVVQCDPEMRNRVSEIEVPLMSTAELRGILFKGEELLNISIGPDLKREIILLSNGLATVCHSLGLGLCRALALVETADVKMVIGENELQKAIVEYIEDSSDSLKGVFDKALYRKKQGKFDNFRIVIEGLARIPQEGGTKGDILQYVRANHLRYPQSNLEYCLKELQTEGRSELVRYDQTSGRYSFSNPFYRAYALAYFNKNKGATKRFIIKSGGTGDVVVKVENIAKIVEAMLSKWASPK
jgi:hypothetical protein